MNSPSLYEYCNKTAVIGKTLLNQWVGKDEFGNELNIKEIPRSSSIKAMWRCSKGHEWATAISIRTTQKSGCPYCSRSRFNPTFSDYMMNNPEYGKLLVNECTNTKLDGLKTDIMLLTITSKIAVKWKCKNGHKWYEALDSRIRNKSSCPVCSKTPVQFGKYTNRISDLPIKLWCGRTGEFGKHLASELTKQDKNGNIVNLDSVKANSTVELKWKCRYGHIFNMPVSYRTECRLACPYCED